MDPTLDQIDQLVKLLHIKRNTTMGPLLKPVMYFYDHIMAKLRALDLNNLPAHILKDHFDDYLRSYVLEEGARASSHYLPQVTATLSEAFNIRDIVGAPIFRNIGYYGEVAYQPPPQLAPFFLSRATVNANLPNASFGRPGGPPVNHGDAGRNVFEARVATLGNPNNYRNGNYHFAAARRRIKQEPVEVIDLVSDDEDENLDVNHNVIEIHQDEQVDYNVEQVNYDQEQMNFNVEHENYGQEQINHDKHENYGQEQVNFNVEHENYAQEQMNHDEHENYDQEQAYYQDEAQEEAHVNQAQAVGRGSLDTSITYTSTGRPARHAAVPVRYAESSDDDDEDQPPAKRARTSTTRGRPSSAASSSSTPAAAPKPPKARNHFCPVARCGKAFSSPTHLGLHALTHTGERPHTCTDCGKSFNQKCNLDTHRRTHTGVRTHRCVWPDCAYTAIRSTSVIQHVRTVHFKLPATKAEQLRRNIVDDREARVYCAKI